MTISRIDQLRNAVAAIGQEQIRYHRSFPGYADRLEEALGVFLGDPNCAALEDAASPIDFDGGSCWHGGIGFDPDGNYRLPVMVRMKNLSDDGAYDVRLILRCKLDAANNVTISIRGFEPTHKTFAPDDLHGSCEMVFECLKSLFDEGSWFDRRVDYQSSGIGFVPAAPGK